MHQIATMHPHPLVPGSTRESVLCFDLPGGPAVPEKCSDFVLKNLFTCACIQNSMKICLI